MFSRYTEPVTEIQSANETRRRRIPAQPRHLFVTGLLLESRSTRTKHGAKIASARSQSTFVTRLVQKTASSANETRHDG